MPIYRPAALPLPRQCAAVLVAAFWSLTAAAAPDAAGAAPNAAVSVSAGTGENGATAAEAGVAYSTSDPLLRLLAVKSSSLTAPMTTARPDSTDPQTVDSPLVDRLRDKASDMVLTAMNFLGVPYRRGGDDADRGFDCSGFTRRVFELSLGWVLPRRAEQQASGAGLLHIGREQLKPGDLVFFNTMRRTFSHVGIYVGAGKFIHSPKPGGEVRVDDLHAAYWEKRFTGGRRAEPIGAAPPADATTAGVGTLN